jgi:hypothetical protein
VDGRAGEFLAELGARVHERSVGHVEPHQLHHHLVGIGGAIEGTGAGAVIALALGLQQLGLADLAFGVELADALLFLVGKARRHRPAGHQDGGQMAEAEPADQQAGHDLVADAEHRDAFEHGVRQADSRCHCDGVAAEQAELHAALPLGDAVAHGRDAAGDLGGGAHFTGKHLHLLGVAAIGLVGRQHVVEGRDDPDVEGLAAADGGLVPLGGGKAVGEIGAGERRAVQALVAFAGDEIEIAAAGPARPIDDARRDGFDCWMQGDVLRHGRSVLRDTNECRWHGMHRPAAGRSDIASRPRRSAPFPARGAFRRR